MNDFNIEPDHGQLKLITFRINDQEFCVDIMAVREIRCWTPTTPMPQAPDYMCGIVNLRGAVLPIIDLSSRMGLGRTQPSPRHVIIVVQIGARMVGVLVDGVSEILTASPDTVQPPPDLACDTVEKYVDAILVMEGRMISRIVLDAILGDSAQLQIAA